MTRREDATTLGTNQPAGNRAERRHVPEFGQNPVSTWLSELEMKSADEFQRRTGLDYKTTIAQILEAAEPFPGMHVLDVPTETGVIARHFVGQVGEKGRIIGVDSTQEKLDQARLSAQSARVGMRIEWKVMPIEKLAFGNESFDLVNSAMTFHRLDAEKFFAEAYRVLKPGGRLLIADELAPKAEPSAVRDTVRRAWLRFVKRDEVEAEARFHSTDELMQLLRGAGFTQIIFRTLRQRGEHDRAFTLIKAVK
ncbi:MAG: class I SAM-dependent methyltransferase [Blastocatellia bacterium]